MVEVGCSNHPGSILIMADFPEYVIKPNATRVIIPQILLTSVLAVIFYIGIALNVYLLRIRIPSSINTLIFAVLGLLVIIQALLSYLQTSKTQYLVYRNRIQIEGPKQQYIMFNTIQGIKISKNIFDRMLNTGTIIIEPKIKIQAIPNFDQNYVYLNQMMQFARTQYSQF